MRKLILLAGLMLAGCAYKPAQQITPVPAPVSVDPTQPVTRTCDVAYLRDGQPARPSQLGNAIVVDRYYQFSVTFLDTGKNFVSPLLTMPGKGQARLAEDSTGVQWVRSPVEGKVVFGMQMMVKGHLITVASVC